MDTVRVVFNTGKEVRVPKGIKLSQVIKDAGYPMDFPCGGVGKCGQCKVEVAELKVKGENSFNTVLACSYIVNEDVAVQLPAGLEDRGAVILTSGAKTAIALNSPIKKQHLAADRLAKEGSYWQGLGKVLAELGISGTPELPILQALAEALANNRQQGITLVTRDKQLINVEKGDTTQRLTGLAVDIGTTTVVGYLIDLNTGEELAVGAELNGQRVYGADVISRITAAQSSEENLIDLQKQVVATINKIIDKVVAEAGIEPKDIYSMTIAGNTTMHHLVLRLNPANLGRTPFLPVFRKGLDLSAAELGIQVNPLANLWVFPVIAGFVGGDTVAAILASELHHEKGVKLLVDIGTNGELVLNAHGRMAACSAAAGPALEGAQITHGMRAETGAISRVRLTPEINLEVIGGGAAKGICGSGLVDLLGELVMAKLVTENGGFVKPDRYSGPEYLRERLIKGEMGYKFLLLKASENKGKEIFLNQEDLMQLQLAKGALRAAMELLVRRVGISGNEVEELLLAGAFGNFLDIPRAHAIGMLPDWAEGRVRSIGNAAGEGAKLALLAHEKRTEAALINKEVEFLELAGTSEFQEAFISGMLFNRAK